VQILWPAYQEDHSHLQIARLESSEAVRRMGTSAGCLGSDLGLTIY
jgi:hypothetical protein